MQITADTYKERCEYRLAGQLDALQGKPAHYGCHFGMRSTRDRAIADYYHGWSEVDALVSR